MFILFIYTNYVIGFRQTQLKKSVKCFLFIAQGFHASVIKQFIPRRTCDVFDLFFDNYPVKG
jgi:hypothetical protein